MTAAGGCRCGAVRFETRGEPLRVGVCHCESCRKATGAPFAVFVDYPRDAVAFTGEPAVWRPRPDLQRLFCAACGSPLAYIGGAWPDETSLHLGAFDAPEAFAPNHVTFADEGLAWALEALEPLKLGDH